MKISGRRELSILFALTALGALLVAASFAKGVKFDPPRLKALGTDFAARWEKGFNAAWPILYENLREPAPPHATRFIQPGPAWPDQVFLWDTAFMSLVWLPWDWETAKEINLAVLNQADRGWLQHTVGGGVITRDTQPPVMAWAVWKIYEWTRDRAYLERTYPVLKDYNRWLYENRALANGLFFWVHPFESGMDNAPRFSNSDASKVRDMKSLAAIDLSSFMVLQDLSLARMAREIGLNDDAAAFEAKAQTLKDLINRELWDPQTGYYYDRDLKTNELVKVRSIASLLPLFCEVPSSEQAAIMVGHIMNPAEFNTYFPLPSVARDDPAFEKDMWRGPVWINTSYMIVKGLRRYGYHAEAADLAFRTVDGVYRNYEITGEFLEFYDPDHDGIQDLDRKRHKWNPFARKTPPRFHFVGWTGLVNNLVLEEFIGVHGVCTPVEPNFPPQFKGMKIKLEMWNPYGLNIEMTIGPDRQVQGGGLYDGVEFNFKVKQGESIELPMNS